MEVDLDYLPDEFKNFKSGLGGNYDNKVHLTKKSKAINEVPVGAIIVINNPIRSLTLYLNKNLFNLLSSFIQPNKYNLYNY